MNHFIIRIALISIPLLMASSLSATEAPYPVDSETLKSWHLPEVTYPESNSYQKSAEELGKQLFFDPRLIGNRSLSCAACHFPGSGWSDPFPDSSDEKQSLERQTPTLINVAFQNSFFWDGRSKTLEDAIELHLKELSLIHGNPIPLPPSYRDRIAALFGDDGKQVEGIAKALANFLRTITVKNTPFDRWVQGDPSALSQSAKAGFILFTGKAECVRCHTAPNFSDSGFHNTGVNSLDPGRSEVTGRINDRSRFRTSSLRQITHTPPYMHSGTKRTLMDVIEFYSHGGDRHGKNNELKALNLTEQEERELLDFLTSLTGSDISISIPQLPIGGALLQEPHHAVKGE